MTKKIEHNDDLGKCANCDEPALFVQAGGVPFAFCATHKPDNVTMQVEEYRKQKKDRDAESE